MPELIGLVVLLPLLGFLTIALLGPKMSEKAAATLACAAVGLAFLAAVGAAVTPLVDKAAWPKYNLFNYDWTLAGSWRVQFGLVADPLSVTMALVVTGVGFLIHVYSVGYMTEQHHGETHFEKDYRRFFAYLNLFVFAMLLLVTANNFILLLIGWGNVGLASFLLIGFYKNKPSAVNAARKAFVMNSIGDVGILIGSFILIITTGQVAFDQVFASRELLTNSEATNWAALFLLVGAVAKSAQFPLQTWLPDAMEGPTPVSALIHAATMVTAGVYLITRAHPIFGVAQWAVIVIPIIGAFTAFYAATCALVQTDIKRVLAYSTMSQLGYMFMAAGVGAYEAAMFHLVTHAFFKALLFLSAGSVIHALGGEQNMFNMGGLRKAKELRVPWLGFLLGALALSGIPPLAGFFSKEAILGTFPLFGQTTSHYNPIGLAPTYLAIFGWVGIITAFMTAFYMFRAYMLVFEGPQGKLHPHNNPLSMNFPKLVLTLLTVVGGFLAMPGFWNFLTDWFKPIIKEVEFPEGGGVDASLNALKANKGELWYRIQTDKFEVVEIALGVGAGVAGIVLAVALYSYLRSQQAKRAVAVAAAANREEIIRPAATGTTRRDPRTQTVTPRAMSDEEIRDVISGKSEKRVVKPGSRAEALNYSDWRKKQNTMPNPGKLLANGLRAFLFYGWGFDLLYNLLFVWPAKLTARIFSRWLDPEVERAYDFGLGGLFWEGSKLFRKTQTGNIRNYGLAVLLGAVALVAYVIIQAAVR